MAPRSRAVDGRALLVLAGIAALALAGRLLVAEPVLQYATGLLAFALWMAWFVLAAVRWLSTPDA